MLKKLSLITTIIFFTNCGNNDGGDDAVEDGSDALPDMECLSDSDCSNGLDCDGAEVCIDGVCSPGEPIDCSNDDPCTVDFCSEETGGCVHELLDEDGDGVYAREAPDGTPCEGIDCDDSNNEVYPGADEKCDMIDNDCDDDIYDDLYIRESEIRITNALGDSEQASLAFSGSEYGLVWTSQVSVPNSVKYFSRISAEGVKVGEDMIFTNAWSPITSSLVFTGSEYGVVWSAFPDESYEIYFARISEDGVKTGEDTRITNFPGESATYNKKSIAFSGSEYGVVWHDNREGNYEVYFARISADGEKTGDDVMITHFSSSDSRFPAIAFGSSEYGVVWWRHDSDDTYAIYFARISSEGNKIGGNVKVTDLLPRFAWAGVMPSIAWTGSEYGITYSNDFDWEIFFSRVSASGEKIGDDIKISNGRTGTWNSSLVYTGDHYAVAWNDIRDDDWEIYFARFSDTGEKMGEDMRLSNNPGDSVSSSLVFTGSEYAVAWQDKRDGNWEIYFTRIGCME